MNDPLNESVLRNACCDLTGLRVFFYDCCDSTNTRAKEWLLAGNRGAALFAAAMQTAGRGRLGRGFYSPAGSGIYLTLTCPMEAPADAFVPVTCAAAVAVLRAVRARTGRQTEVKWVNDLYFAGRKVCGILAEAVTVGEQSAVAVGIGVNLRPAAFPPELAGIAGSLDDGDTPRAELIAEIARQLLPFLRQPDRRDWLEDYRAHSCLIGRQITFFRNGEPVPATAVGIDDNGGLTVVTESGAAETLRTGEVTVRLR